MTPHLEINNLTMAYGDSVIQKNLNFTVKRGEIFIIMGGSGCGKSTLLRHLIGLLKPSEGEILVNGVSLWNTSFEERNKIISRSGVLFQGGALWSSMTLGENIELLLTEYTQLNNKQRQDVISYKLSLVGLSRYKDYYPSEISGGMRKRAGLARAIALDPEILFFDEPSAGLDPVSSRLLDNLILELRDSLGATIVIVSHELASIFTVGDNAIFLDPTEKTIIATGAPKHLLESSEDSRVIQFLTRTI
ncbi:phospholipid/cholesterol/gamma-HCH transport system ATP-binding protein [Desulfuromusa kysingii]|uniref:Phospholipid/cholesterol/gamma-HCH transport system ATP-binding protein n=1 Tax=Desulfuromusa kysingii TaxID=37625 RepID=A0A1H3YUC7_9BACT|nr:ATP-binding cassette domain-containing protein [Desulfuromusa kysingii]SEA14678.1 phospholipid/cholesterol/gamma-HCH transport system ATP-binding protein [Desulfuromusa kysingii]